MTLQTRTEALEKKVQQLESKVCHIDAVEQKVQRSESGAHYAEHYDQQLEHQKTSYIELLEKKVQHLESYTELLEKKLHLMEAQQQQLDSKACHAVLLEKQPSCAEILNQKVQQFEAGKVALEPRVQELENKLCNTMMVQKEVQELQIQVQQFEIAKTASEEKVLVLENKLCNIELFRKQVQQLKDTNAALEQKLDHKTKPVVSLENKKFTTDLTTPRTLDSGLEFSFLNLIPVQMRDKALKDLKNRPFYYAVVWDNYTIYNWCKNNDVPAIPVLATCLCWSIALCHITESNDNIITWRDLPHKFLC